MRQKRLSATLGIGYMIAGACFLISPMLAVVDILPDFIGYALILKGIYCLSDMNDDISEAARLFRRMVILGLVRIALVFFVYGMASPTEQPTLQLLCSFVLAVLDCMTLIPAWKHFSNGLIYLGTRNEGTAVFDKRYPGSRQKRSRGNKSRTEKVTAFTLFFLVAREALSVLPEFAVLTHEKGGAEEGNRIMLYEFIGFMRQVCALAVVVLGIIWLVKFIRYMKHLQKDTLFFENLRRKYETEVLTRPELFARRGVKTALVFLCVGLVFTADFYLDNVCITPDFLFGLFAVIGLLLIRKFVKTKMWVCALTAAMLYIPATAVEWLLQINYFPLSEAPEVYRHIEPYTRWVHMLMIRGGTLVLGLLLLLFLLLVLMQAVKRYTGFSITQHDSATPNLRVREVHRNLNMRLWVALGMAVLAAAASFVYLLTLPLAQETLWEAWLFADLLVSGIFVAFFIHTVSVIFEQIDYKYMLS